MGYNRQGSIDMSYSSGAVDGNDGVGGLAGENSGHIAASYSTGAVSGAVDIRTLRDGDAVSAEDGREAYA